jgi:solute carrier family 27 fatty acid transporter 1/4
MKMNFKFKTGNCTMINTTSKIGACGFVPLFNYIYRIFPVCVIKIDEEMNPIRDEKTGFCIECKRGEKGLVVGVIGNSPTTAYNGYANNPNASNSKIIKNLFRKNQNAFNSGDMMICDEYGYMSFCDRLGDTYRWRGENIATLEVENVIISGFNSLEVCKFKNILMQN